MGTFPPHLQALIRTIHGKNRFVVPVAVAGNVQYGKALNHLVYALERQGLRPIAAGAFVGRHSFATEEFPVAMDRPNEDDLRVAEELGRCIAEKVIANNWESLSIRGLAPPAAEKIRSMGRIDTTLHYDEKKCEKCLSCVKSCPFGAIRLDDGLHVESELCVRCGACGRVCPTGALTFSPPISGMLKRLFQVAARRKMPSRTFS
jgi:ferredoxin